MKFDRDLKNQNYLSSPITIISAKSIKSRLLKIDLMRLGFWNVRISAPIAANLLPSRLNIIEDCPASLELVNAEGFTNLDVIMWANTLGNSFDIPRGMHLIDIIGIKPSLDELRLKLYRFYREKYEADGNDKKFVSKEVFERAISAARDRSPAAILTLTIRSESVFPKVKSILLSFANEIKLVQFNRNEIQVLLNETSLSNARRFSKSLDRAVRNALSQQHLKLIESLSIQCFPPLVRDPRNDPHPSLNPMKPQDEFLVHHLKKRCASLRT